MAHQLASGVIAAAILPFEADGSIDWKTFASYIAGVAAGAPRAIAMNMAVSEVSSLSEAEQVEVIRRTKSILGGQCALLSGVNATNTRVATELAKKFVEAGAEGIVVFPPVPAFLSSPSIEMITDYHGAIADVVSVPLIAFQTNFATYPKGTITALSKIEGIVSIKDASFNVDQTLDNIKEANSSTRKIGVLTGSDTFILEAMLMGCDGALIGFAATATAALVQMHSLAATGKITEAFEIWSKLAPLARVCWRQPIRDYRVRTKYALSLQGVIPNYLVRAPFPALQSADKSDIDRVFQQFDLAASRFLPAGRETRRQAAE